MKTIIASILISVGLSPLTHLQHSPKAHCSAPLQIKTSASRIGKETAVLFLTLSNKDKRCSIRNVKVEAGPNAVAAAPSVVSTLAPQDQQTLRYYLRNRPEGAYALVSYESDGKEYSAAETLELASQGPQTNYLLVILPGLVGALISFAGVLIGGRASDWYTRRREKSRADFDKQQEQGRQQFEMDKALYERYEGALLRFLNNWGDSVNPQIFEDQFRQLRNEVLMPTPVLQAYQMARDVLASDASLGDKTRAVATFRSILDEFIFQPWGSGLAKSRTQ